MEPDGIANACTKKKGSVHRAWRQQSTEGLGLVESSAASHLPTAKKKASKLRKTPLELRLLSIAQRHFPVGEK